MLKLRSIGIRDYSVFEGGQRIGRIRFAGERMPGVWLWNVVTLPGTDLDRGRPDRSRRRLPATDGSAGRATARQLSGQGVYDAPIPVSTGWKPAFPCLRTPSRAGNRTVLPQTSLFSSRPQVRVRLLSSILPAGRMQMEGANLTLPGMPC